MIFIACDLTESGGCPPVFPCFRKKIVGDRGAISNHLLVLRNAEGVSRRTLQEAAVLGAHWTALRHGGYAAGSATVFGVKRFRRAMGVCL
jgi:hypothetical protein